MLDYFTSPAQRPLAKIMSWEADHVLKPGRPLVALLRSLCREVALAVPHPHALLCDGLPTSSSLMHNSPELRAYRDLGFFWKWFLNPDRSAFPNARAPKKKDARADERVAELKRRPRMAAQLVWQWDGNEGGYQVTMAGTALRCRPDPNALDPVTGRKVRPEDLPQHRFPSAADPAAYVPPPPLRTEDDVIYRPGLPGFGDAASGAPAALGQRDAELLLSFLTVPYIRLPLVLTFFSRSARATARPRPRARLARAPLPRSRRRRRRERDGARGRNDELPFFYIC